MTQFPLLICNKSGAADGSRANHPRWEREGVRWSQGQGWEPTGTPARSWNRILVEIKVTSEL